MERHAHIRKLVCGELINDLIVKCRLPCGFFLFSDTKIHIDNQEKLFKYLAWNSPLRGQCSIKTKEQKLFGQNVT